MQQKDILINSMNNLINHISQNRKNQQQMFLSLTRKDFEKILTNLEDSFVRLRITTVHLLTQLLYNNVMLKEKFCEKLGIQFLGGSNIILNNNFRRIVDRYEPARCKQLFLLIKSHNKFVNQGDISYSDQSSKLNKSTRSTPNTSEPPLLWYINPKNPKLSIQYIYKKQLSSYLSKLQPQPQPQPAKTTPYINSKNTASNTTNLSTHQNSQQSGIVDTQLFEFDPVDCVFGIVLDQVRVGGGELYECQLEMRVQTTSSLISQANSYMKSSIDTKGRTTPTPYIHPKPDQFPQPQPQPLVHQQVHITPPSPSHPVPGSSSGSGFPSKNPIFLKHSNNHSYNNNNNGGGLNSASNRTKPANQSFTYYEPSSVRSHYGNQYGCGNRSFDAGEVMGGSVRAGYQGQGTPVSNTVNINVHSFTNSSQTHQPTNPKKPITPQQKFPTRLSLQPEPPHHRRTQTFQTEPTQIPQLSHNHRQKTQQIEIPLHFPGSGTGTGTGTGSTQSSNLYAQTLQGQHYQGGIRITTPRQSVKSNCGSKISVVNASYSGAQTERNKGKAEKVFVPSAKFIQVKEKEKISQTLNPKSNIEKVKTIYLGKGHKGSQTTRQHKNIKIQRY